VARAYLPSERELDRLLEELVAHGKIRQPNPKRDGRISLSLTLTGWEMIRNQRTGTSTRNQAFVAMWFHDAMSEVFDQGIVPAVTGCGYRPYRVDRDAHVDRIDSKIVAEIRASQLLIADVTGERCGVYYEAGLAEGLDIPVIWSCNRSYTVNLQRDVHPETSGKVKSEKCNWPDRMHFDTRQFSHILWDDAADLNSQLEYRIRALGLARPTE
jgi:hypothetical protein